MELQLVSKQVAIDLKKVGYLIPTDIWYVDASEEVQITNLVT